ncbi:hypothetical protein QL093DRAFT_2152978 [Fusarium oxysporum]|nr:hypothetical protein QL093DRAFT_2152978 [Fusarium oxysporum]
MRCCFSSATAISWLPITCHPWPMSNRSEPTPCTVLHFSCPFYYTIHLFDVQCDTF